ncbi:recombinase RecT [uncultured Dialister sp.]|uniref:recombinase RecT n=1 Tax=uncultured Dialister sp. TaxID=278064 RepID=UPI0020651057|nr:recombinase RecT [uncultured Dialister sp.]DAE67627.1 MAG TPA: RecT protein [Caudoviricetes sp.]
MDRKGGLEVRKASMQQGGNAKTTMQGLIQAMEPQIRKALPSVITPERFTRMVLTALSSTPKLQTCTPQSFLGAMMQAAQLGVEPNTPLGQAYLIPYGNVCQFQLGYKGLIDLAYRSGEVSSIQAHEVHENDVFEYEYGLEPKLKHVPAQKDRGNVIMYYAVLKLKNGGVGFEVMSREDVEAFARKKSKAYSNGPWKTDFDEMAKKTVLKKVLKYAPLKTEFARAVATDETVKSTLSDNMADEPNEVFTTIDNEPAAAPEEAPQSEQKEEKK